MMGHGGPVEEPPQDVFLSDDPALALVHADMGTWLRAQPECLCEGLCVCDQPPKKECGFCKGQPVADAASWLDGKPRPPLPCPRCGELNL